MEEKNQDHEEQSPSQKLNSDNLMTEPTNQNDEIPLEKDNPDEKPADEKPADGKSETDKSVQLALMDIMDEIGMPIDYEFIEKAGEINSITVQKIKLLLLATKELKNYHEKLKLQFKTIENQPTSSSSTEEELTIRLSENLKHLEETRLKKIVEDLIERFLKEEPVQQPSDDPENKQLLNLEEYILNIGNLQSVIKSLKEENIKLKKNLENIPEKAKNISQMTETSPDEANSHIEQLNKTIQSKNKRISELETEIQEKIRLIESSRNEIQKIQELTEQKNNFESQINEYKEKLTESTTEYEILKEEKNILQNRVNQYESELDRTKETSEELKDRIKEIEFQQEDFNQMTEDYEKLIEEKHEFQTKLTETVEKLEHNENELHQIQINLNKTKDENNHLRSQLSLKETQIEELSAEIKLKNEDISNLRNQITNSQDTTESFANLDKELAEKELLITDLQTEIRNYENKLADMVYREELEQFKEQISNLENQLEEKRQKIQSMQEEMVNLRATFSDKQIDYQKQIDDLKDELTKKSELEQLVKEKEAALIDYEKQEEEFHEALLDKVRITAEKEDLNEKINELIEQKKVLYERIQQLNNRDRGHVAIIERLEKNVKNLESKIEETKEGTQETLKEKVEREFLEGQIEKLNKELREQIAAASEAKGKYDIVQDQIEQMNQKHENLRNQHENLKQDLNMKERRYEEQILQLNQELDEKAQEIRSARKEIYELEEKLQVAVSGEEFKEKITSLKLDLQEQQQIAESLAEDISKKELDVSKLENENDRLSDEIIQLKRRIKLMRRDLAHK